MIQVSKIYQVYFYLHKSHMLISSQFLLPPLFLPHILYQNIYSFKKNVKNVYESTGKLSVLDEPNWD